MKLSKAAPTRSRGLRPKPTTSCSWTSDLDGVETTKRIRKMHGAAAEVPIVALTAHAMKGDRETYLAAGMDGYVSKPIRGRELLAALAPYLSREEERVHPKPTRHGGAVPGSHGSLASSQSRGWPGQARPFLCW
jgi:DNA-binding response OmpR family regulator